MNKTPDMPAPAPAEAPAALRPLTTLSALIAARRIDHGPLPGRAEVHFHITDDWLQGRTTFGGLISALAAQAMRDGAGGHWPADVSLRAMQTSFVGPVSGGAVTVEVQLLREGKHVRQVQATVRQQGQVAAVMLGMYASERSSSLATVYPVQPAATRPPGQLPARRLVPGAAPEFLRHFDMRWEHGPMPGSGGTGLHTRIHMRMLDTRDLSDELVAVMLADTSPTPATGHLHRPAPASSVSWALELRPLKQAADPAGWWRADNESVVIDGGYVNHSARLWAPSGELAALAYQVVGVFG